MAVNRGKDFEQQIREDCQSVKDLSFIRLIDPQNGFAGVRNICDFIAYKYPYQVFIECKSVHGNTLPFSNITKNQFDGLVAESKIKGCIAGVICWFVDRDVTVFIPIQTIYKMKASGEKSVHVDALDDLNCIKINGIKKRVLFVYDMTRFFKDLFTWYKLEHGEF